MKQTKVICGGCFNKIHKGHTYFLKKCKALGNFLVVVLSNDRINKKKYGKKAIPAKIRKKNIKKLGIADKVIVGNKTNRLITVKREKPNIIALGYDQKMPELKEIKIIRMARIKKL